MTSKALLRDGWSRRDSATYLLQQPPHKSQHPFQKIFLPIVLVEISQSHHIYLASPDFHEQETNSPQRSFHCRYIYGARINWIRTWLNMAHQQTPDALEFTPVQQLPLPSGATMDADIERAEKDTTEHVEDIDGRSKALANFQYNAEEDETKPRTGIARLYRKNPSVDFMREVAIANSQELDPEEVKKVRHIFPPPPLGDKKKEFNGLWRHIV